MRNLALISLPVGGVLNLIAVGVLMFYRIDRRAHEANLEALKHVDSPGSNNGLIAGAGRQKA